MSQLIFVLRFKHMKVFTVNVDAYTLLLPTPSVAPGTRSTKRDRKIIGALKPYHDDKTMWGDVSRVVVTIRSRSIIGFNRQYTANMTFTTLKFQVNSNTDDNHPYVFDCLVLSYYC